MLSYKRIGRNIRRARKRMGISQEQVAQMLDVSQSYYGKLERGDDKPALDRLEQICEVLSISIETALCGASSRNEFDNMPEPADISDVIIRLIQNCDASHRKAILEICSVIEKLYS